MDGQIARLSISRRVATESDTTTRGVCDFIKCRGKTSLMIVTCSSNHWFRLGHFREVTFSWVCSCGCVVAPVHAKVC
jgi:hypothetical protein